MTGYQRAPTRDEDTDIERILGESVARMRERTIFHDPPPPDFEPLKRSAEERAAFFFPTEPDSVRSPAYRRFWTDLLTPPETGFVYLKGDIAPPAATRIGVFRSIAGGPIPREASANWSGAYVTPSGGARFGAVMGRWRVPEAVVPGGAGATAAYLSSTWVGLDGQRRYRHSSLPQIGTEQNAGTLPVNVPDYGAWYQWWERDHSTIPMRLAFPVAVGDEAFALLEAISPTVVRFHLRVGAAYTRFDVLAPTGTVPPVAQYRVTGATAEWVMERQSPVPGPSEPYDLPAYSSFVFDSCLALGEDTAGRPHDADLNPGHLIRMQDVLHAPMRRRTISIARRVARDTVRLIYSGP